MMTLEAIIRLSQRQLFYHLQRLFADNNVACEGKYLLVKGEMPILLVAHLDTVHREKVKNICYSEDGNILMSPQGIGGDDRCGVYALVKAYEQANKKPWMLFTCDEETGAGGARAFTESYAKKKLPQELDQIKCMVEIDRKGSRDAVYYDCANEDFENYISSKGFQTAIGSFSDISVLAPALGVAAVNLSAGYYHAHTQHEYIDRSQLETVIAKVGEIIQDAAGEDFPRYEFIGETLDGYVPTDVPGKYAELYNILLDYYFPEEIEEYRMAYGNVILQALYENAFGVPYRISRKRKVRGSDVHERGWTTGEIPQAASDDGTYNKSRTGQTVTSAWPEQKSDTVASAVPLC